MSLPQIPMILFRTPLFPLLLALAPLAVAAPAADQDAPTSQNGPPPVPVRVAEARGVNLSEVLWVPGTVLARSDARLAAEVAGRLEWVAEVGDEVGKGDPVARIDDRALELRLRDGEAQVRRLEARLAYLDKERERLAALEAEQIAARRQLDEIVSQRDMAVHELEQAKVAAEITRDLIERSVARAPFSGQVVERFQQAGEYSNVGGPLVRLVDVRHTEVRARAPLEVAPGLAAGMEVRLKDDGRELKGRTRAVIPVADERSRMFELRVVVESGTSPWPVGAAVRVALPKDKPGTSGTAAVAVPRDALVLRSDSVYVFKLRDDDTVERVAVETGAGEDELIEVRGDLAAGDRVVIRGGERLRGGEAVVVQEG